MDDVQVAEAIKRVNERLEKEEPDSVSEDKSGAYTSTGYAWQYIVDAVNDELGPLNWRYDLIDLTVTDKAKSFYAEARLKLYVIYDGEEYPSELSRGETIGSSTNINHADAQKGAITDALKKGFSLWSIGNKAFRGELKGSGKKNPPKKPAAKKPTTKTDDINEKLSEIHKYAAASGLTPEQTAMLIEDKTGKKIPLEEDGKYHLSDYLNLAEADKIIDYLKNKLGEEV